MNPLLRRQLQALAPDLERHPALPQEFLAAISARYDELERKLAVASPADLAGEPVSTVREDAARPPASAAGRSTEKRYQLLVDSSRDAMMTLEPPTWKFTSCNPAALALFGARDEAEFCRHGPDQLSTEVQADGRPSAEKAPAMIEVAMRHGSHFFEWTHRRLDGTPFPATVLLSRMEDGAQVFLQATVRDISAQKRAEAALREREQLLTSINENVAGTIIYRAVHLPNGEMRCNYVSPGTQALIGVPPESFQARPATLFELIHADDLPAFRREVARVLCTGEVTDIIVRLRHATTGAERWMHFRSRLSERRADGTQVRDGVVTDVTQLKEAEAELRRGRDFFSALQASTLELLEHFERTELFRSLVAHAGRLLDADLAEISLLDGDELVVQAHASNHPQVSGDRVGRTAAPLSWQAIDRREPVAVANYGTHPLARPLYAGQGIRACAIFPISAGSLCLGVIGLARTMTDRPFTGEELQHGRMFAQIAALVMRNAGIYDEAKRLAESHTAALRASEQRLDRVVRNIHDALIIDDAEGRLTYANAIFFRLFGRPECDPRTLTLEDYVAPEWHAELRERHRQRLAGADVPEHYEFEGLRGDGTRLWLEATVAPVVEQGKISGSQSAIRDITARKRAEAALHESEAHYRALVESVTQGYYVANRHGNFTYCNPALEAMGGFAPGEMLGVSSFRLVVEEDRRRVMRDYKTWIADPACTSVTCEFRVEGKNGRRFWVEQSTGLQARCRGPTP